MNEIEILKENILSLVKSKMTMKKYDLKDFKSFSYPKLIKVFKFSVQQYKVSELGNMSILEAKSLIGMKLLTTIFTPEANRDIPFVIIDFVEVKDKITVFIEFYTSYIIDKDNIKVLENELIKKGDKYKEIENYTENPRWYVPLRARYSPLKKGDRSNRLVLEKMIIDYLEAYLSFVKNMNKDNALKKNEYLERFIDDLIVKGNPSTKIINKALGKEKAERFFRDIIFYIS